MDLRAQVESIVEKIMAAVQALATQLDGPPATAAQRLDPRALERQCRDLGLAVGHELFVRLLRGYGDGTRGTAVRCGCGGTRRWVGRRSRTLRDLMNREVTLERAYYDCGSCGQGWLPLDETLGVPRAQVTPALYEVAVSCGSVAPPEEAAELLTLVAGIALSPKSIERYTKAAGGRGGPRRRRARGMLRMRDGTFREVKVACLFDARDRAELREGRHELLHKHYEVHLGGPAPLGHRTYAAARADGATADGADVVSQGDGAPWVWHLVQEHWPAAWEVLDRKSTRLNSSHSRASRMPSSA